MVFAASIAACVLPCPRQHFGLGPPTKGKISRLVVFEIADGKFAKEAGVVFLSELIVPRSILCLDGILVFAEELMGSLENVEFCRE